MIDRAYRGEKGIEITEMVEFLKKTNPIMLDLVTLQEIWDIIKLYSLFDGCFGINQELSQLNTTSQIVVIHQIQ